MEYSDVYNQAVKYLGMRSHTVFELRTKLGRKKLPRELVEKVLGDLQEQKYLNDEDFARVFTQNLVKYKTFGYYGILAKLKQRGVANDTAVAILEEELGLEAEKKIARKAIGKSPKDSAMKVAQMLQRKGFRSQVISQCVGDFEE
jgi:regulatory protein